MTRKWEPCGGETNNVPVADVHVRSLILFPLKQISYTFICFKINDNLMVVRIFRINLTFCLKLRSMKRVLSLCNDVIGYFFDCLQVTC